MSSASDPLTRGCAPGPPSSYTLVLRARHMQSLAARVVLVFVREGGCQGLSPPLVSDIPHWFEIFHPSISVAARNQTK